MSPWLRSTLPPWAQPVLELLLDPRVEVALTLLSIVMFVGSLLALPYLVARLPVDYFAPHADSPEPRIVQGPVLGLVARVLKNLAGLTLLLAGVAMLFLPGQGVLTMLMALVLLEFPGKHRLVRRVVRKPRVLGALNALRRRAKREPLVVD